VSDLTAKQISFCENYILTRDIKQSSLNAGYSKSYSKSKAYELLQDEKIQQKIEQLEKEHNQEHFKKLSMLANKELETILLGSDNDNTRLRAIELVYKLSGVIQDERIFLSVNNTNINQNTKTLDDFYDIENI
jgi:phage terminase small subunit